jgi:hypothetical protein
MIKMSSSESSQGDSMVCDLKRDYFSIQIISAQTVTPEVPGSYFSIISPISQAFATFTIETKSKLPKYESANKTHVVVRRFSDFEYLLK